MPAYTPQNTYVDPALTNASLSYIQSLDNFAADKVFAPVPSLKQSGRYFKYNRNDLNRDDIQIISPNTELHDVTYGIDNTPSFFCDGWGGRQAISWDEIDNADPAVDPEDGAMEHIMNKLMIRKERLFAAKFFTTSLWGTDITGVASGVGSGEFLQWNDANSNPIEDIRRGKTLVGRTGFMPNVLCLSLPVWHALIDHPDFIDRVKGGSVSTMPAILMRQAMAQILELDEVVVSMAGYTTSAEGATTQTDDYALGKHALLVHRPGTVGVRQPAAGYTFTWTGKQGVNQRGVMVRRYDNGERECRYVEGRMYFEQKVVSAELGYFFATAVA